MRRVAAVVAVMMVAAAVPAAGVAATDAQSEAYAGTHVAFDTRTDAVTNYTVGGTTVFDSLRVESAESSESGAGGELGLNASGTTAADVAGSAVSVTATAETRATVETDSGATLTAHDTPNGNLVVGGDGSQVLRANVSDEASVREESEGRVVVENGDATSVFIAVGNATVATDDDGDVAGRVGSDGRVVVRTYPEGHERTESDRTAERLVADGTATAEVYVMGEDENRTTEVVRYGGNTTVEVAERSTERVTVTVERSVSEGAVVLTSVSEEALNASDSFEVTVDGEAAANVDAASDLRAAANGGERSAYMVADGNAEADAAADVYVALNHFSERTVTMTSGGDSSPSTTTDSANGTDSATTDEATEPATEGESATESESEAGDSTTTDTSMPGFGASSALLALAGAVLVAARR